MESSPAGRPQPATRPLGLFLVVMLMFGIITSLNGMAPLATYGLGAIFYLGIAIVLFLIPAALVASELGTTYQRDGGVYTWVGEAFGPTAGFVATWLQWLQNVIFWTVVLTGSAAMLAVSLGWTEGAENRLYSAAVVLGTIWLITALSLFGLRSSGVIGTVGTIAGTILPGALLIAFAVGYLLDDQPNNLVGPAADLVPDLTNPANVTFGLAAILVFAGIEVMAARIRDIHAPERTYPRATLISVLMIAALLVPATIAIAILVPADDISITAGIVQAMNAGVEHVWHVGWLVPLMAIAIYLDAIGEIAGWMAATPSAMATAAREGHLPRRLAAQTARNTARPVLIGQAVVGSSISLLFLFQPSVSSMFWLLSALLVQLYVLMYALMFAAALKLRRTQPDTHRPFRIPGGRAGIWLVCGIGIAFSAAAIVVGFIPPAGLDEATAVSHTVILIGAVVLCTAAPVAISRRQRARSHRGPGS